MLLHVYEISYIFIIVLIYFKIYFIPGIKAEILASLLQSSVSHDLSEIIFMICLFIIKFGNFFLLQIFFFFFKPDTFQNSLMNKKEKLLFKIEIFL